MTKKAPLIIKAATFAAGVLAILGLSAGSASAATYSYLLNQQAPLGAGDYGTVTFDTNNPTHVYFQNLWLHDSDRDAAPATMYSRILGANGQWESTGWIDTARTTNPNWERYRVVDRTSRVGRINSVFVKMCEDDGNPNTGYHCSSWNRFYAPA